MSLSIALGAVGAHLLEKSITPKQLETFHTGIKYLSYHALAFVAIGTNSKLYEALTWWKRIALIGILLFSGNCVLYSLTGLRAFAMIVPIGGFSLILAWLVGSIEISKIK